MWQRRIRQQQRHIKEKRRLYNNSCDSNSYNSAITIGGRDGEKRRIQLNLKKDDYVEMELDDNADKD